MKNASQYFVFLLLIVLSYIYYHVDFGASSTDKVFITITTFFFSIFTGFFITRQGTRYTKIREIISTYDGKMSGIFRVAGNLSPKVQETVGVIISDHYKKILETKSWDYHFTHKSTTITSMHNVLEQEIGETKIESLRNQSLGRILTNLGDCQVLRKNMVMLYQEKIPAFQWGLIFLFVLILLATISVIPSMGFFLGSVLKAAFAVSIITVVMILKHLDDLHLFEKFIGENSAKDVLDTIEGSK